MVSHSIGEKLCSVNDAKLVIWKFFFFVPGILFMSKRIKISYCSSVISSLLNLISLSFWLDMSYRILSSLLILIWFRFIEYVCQIHVILLTEYSVDIYRSFDGLRLFFPEHPVIRCFNAFGNPAHF